MTQRTVPAWLGLTASFYFITITPITINLSYWSFTSFCDTTAFKSDHKLTDRAGGLASLTWTCSFCQRKVWIIRSENSENQSNMLLLNWQGDLKGQHLVIWNHCKIIALLPLVYLEISSLLFLSPISQCVSISPLPYERSIDK